MATQAFIPVSLQMGLHKIRLDLSMAGRTNALVKPDITLRVAICTSKGAAVRFGYVSGQRVSKSIVIDFHLAHVHQGGILAAVVRMTILANQSWTIFEEIPMECGRVSQLSRDIGVAGFAQIRHACFTPEGGVTASAPVGKLCMRSDTAKGGPAFRVERPGTEKDPAGHKTDPNHYEHH